MGQQTQVTMRAARRSGVTVALSESDAIHFLRRVGFTAPRGKINAYKGLSRTAAVNKALDFSASKPLNVPNLTYTNQWGGFEDMIDWWYRRMVKSPTPLEEKLTLFWHNHFACSQEKVHDIQAMWAQQKIFRNKGLGNFETLLWNVSKSSAMLLYIDNESNRKGEVQENFGRELMELHTVGVGEYTEADVVAMSRAWTGHNVVGWNAAKGFTDSTYRFYPEHHDTGQKTLFGKRQNWDARDTITELVNGSKQRATARHVARKMWKWFAHDHPSNALVNELATTFINSNMNCKALLRAILLHNDFWAPVSRNALIRNPVELTVAFLKVTGVPLSDPHLWWRTLPMGMTLFEPPNVAGWGENEYWISTATSSGRANFFEGYMWSPPKVHGLFTGIENGSVAAGVQRIFDTFEIWSPTNATRARFESWFRTAKNNHSWFIKHDAIQVGPLCPDFQVI
ncbi:MAG: DUF1800 domain-containing protein [Acidobacteria bacterium]|nr:DUF1800 domain-containing protein [Acidobacteriota bacterium]